MCHASCRYPARPSKASYREQLFGEALYGVAPILAALQAGAQGMESRSILSMINRRCEQQQPQQQQAHNSSNYCNCAAAAGGCSPHVLLMEDGLFLQLTHICRLQTDALVLLQVCAGRMCC
jgi:hypothetical protein